jgi:hypothetical protein
MSFSDDIAKTVDHLHNDRIAGAYPAKVKSQVPVPSDGLTPAQRKLNDITRIVNRARRDTNSIDYLTHRYSLKLDIRDVRDRIANVAIDSLLRSC